MLFFLFGTKLIRNSATLKICCHGSRSVARSIDRCRSRPQHARTDALMNTMSTTPRPDHRTARRSGPWHARPNQGPFFLCYRPLRTLVSCQSRLGAKAQAGGCMIRQRELGEPGEGSLGNSRPGCFQQCASADKKNFFCAGRWHLVKHCYVLAGCEGRAVSSSVRVRIKKNLFLRRAL